MDRTGKISSYYAFIIGAFLLIEGIWGLFSPVTFGVLTTNLTHSIIHILLGIAGIWTGLKGGSRAFCLLLGVIVLPVGIFRFVPGVGDWIVTLFNVNPAVAYFNIFNGILSLLAAFVSGRASAADKN